MSPGKRRRTPVSKRRRRRRSTGQTCLVGGMTMPDSAHPVEHLNAGLTASSATMNSEAADTTRAARTSFLPFHRPWIDDADIAEVVDTLRSGWLTMGPKTLQFEEQFASYV